MSKEALEVKHLELISPTPPEDVESLKQLCKELLEGADKCSQKPFYIVQPFFSIVKKNVDLINTYNLV